ncbi:2',3'-cyclic-nucleotide 2'-phosphodiesterase / 3'-nucleotidase / 5'-nucleotidase [Paenibacillaceae bacterium GAS479]|nr:2',3'-cyclic-nucleotide 2'-phosphodiesterase / 3'-nucleotidase / 5'-nucleotidase [Paenibacillaceae bacterium GAS479]
MRWSPKWNKPTASVLAASVLSAQVLGGAFLFAGEAEAAADPVVKLRIMSTTDLHTNVMGYDYFKAPDKAASKVIGIDRLATLVKNSVNELGDKKQNKLLLDNGDLIQGTPLGTYMAKVNKTPGTHPMIAAMNKMGYDAAALGNHEFNYGINFLKDTYGKADFPYVSANVYKTDTNLQAFEPYKILHKTFKDEQGANQTVDVGVLGLVTPQITEWDKAHLGSDYYTKDIAAQARANVAEMRAAGADIVIAMAHTGFDVNSQEGDFSENAINALSKVDGIDAITFSHTHKAFPTNGNNDALDSLFKDPVTKLPYNNDQAVVDNVKGQINGVPAVQAGYGGGYLGLIDLELVETNGHWSVANSQSSTRSINGLEPDPDITNLVQDAHNKTIAYTNTEIGQTSKPMNSFFAMVQDDPTVQVVTNAQKWFVQNQLNVTNSVYKDLPILSVGAPFKAGRNGPQEYTNIAAGALTIRSAADLYLYDNTLKAVKIKGSVVKEWLEMSAGAFNTISPRKSTAQPLLNPDFAVFNFDVIDGVTYKIDVTKMPKYNKEGALINASSSRIVDLSYNGQPVDPEQEFVVVTNNYRAGGGGNFPGLKGSQLVVDSQNENRQVLMDYIAETGTINPSADGNWSIAPIKGNVNVTFTTAPEAAAAITDSNKIKYTNTTEAKSSGVFGVFNINVKQDAPAPTSDVEVHLIGVNDFHGQMDTVSTVSGKPAGTAAYVAAHVKKAREQYENMLLFHNGDSVGASAPVSALERDKPTLEWMNMMQFDVGSLGNHEFDQGIAALKAQIYGGKDPKDGNIVHGGVDFDYVNANVIDTTTNKPLISPYVIKEVGGVKIGFIGLVTKATPNKVSPSGTAGVKFLSADEEAEAVNKYAAELQAQGVETIVVLAHDPAKTSKVDGKDVTVGESVDLANKLSADSPVDVIVAGDDHAFANQVVNGKLIVQAYSYGSAYDDIKLIIDPKTGDVKAKSAEVKTTFHEGMTPDQATLDLVKSYIDKHPELTESVGTTDGTITRTDAYNNESALGNLIADAMRNAAFEGYTAAADFAFMNPGGIRADLPKGSITYGDLAKVQPFGNMLVKLTLTGAQVKTLLKQQWGLNANGTPNTKTLQISGLKYTADFNLPVESRITSLTTENGTPIEENKTYTAVVNDFMAGGGDNYKVLTEASNKVVGDSDLKGFTNYVIAKFNKGAITAKVEGRITNIKATTPSETPSPWYPTPTATPAPTASPSATPAPSATPTPVPVFSDIAHLAWAKAAIEELTAKGIIKGMTDGKFAPAEEVTRAQFVTMIVRALGLTNSTSSASFSDVKSGAWYEDSIAIAVKAGFVKGSGNGKFEPSRDITREEMAIMINNVLKYLDKQQTVDKKAALAKFEDKAKIASYAQDAVAQLVSSGILNGMDEDSFAPKGLATRAQAAVILSRMLAETA